MVVYAFKSICIMSYSIEKRRVICRTLLKCDLLNTGNNSEFDDLKNSISTRTDKNLLSVLIFWSIWNFFVIDKISKFFSGTKSTYFWLSCNSLSKSSSILFKQFEGSIYLSFLGKIRLWTKKTFNFIEGIHFLVLICLYQ